MKKICVEFDEIIRLCKELARQVKRSRFKPDIIIGVSRGGWVPARLLSEYLGVKLIASIGVCSYDENNKKCKPFLVEELGVDIKDKRVLVIDEVADSGETLEFVKKYLASFKPKKMSLAVIHYKPCSKFRPDYYATKVNEWIVYPWENK